MKPRCLIIPIISVFLSIAAVLPAWPGPEQSNRAAAENYLRQAMFDEAIVAYKAALAAEPADLELRLGYARALAGNELFQRAMDEYEGIISINFNDELMRELSGLYAENVEYERAIAFYNKILADAALNKTARCLLAEAYLGNENPYKAIAEYTTVLNNDPRYLDALVGAGRACYYTKNYRDAEKYFLRAKAVSGTDARVSGGLGNVYFADGNYAAAIGELDNARRQDAENVQVLYALAQAYLKNDDDKNAAKILEELLSKDTGNNEARLALGNVCLSTGAYREALAVLSPVSEQGYVLYQKKLLMAVAYGALGDFRNFRQSLGRIKIAAVILGIFLFLAVGLGIGVIALLLFFAYAAGNRGKNPPDMLTGARWTLVDAFLICVMIFLLPLVLGIIIGAAVYGNWFLIFTGSCRVSSTAVQTALLAQMSALAVICAVVVWLVVKKNRQSLSLLGFTAVPWGRLLRLSGGAVAAIFGVSAGYLFLFSALSGHSPQAQFIGKVVAGSGSYREVVPLFFFVVVAGPLAEEIIFRGFIFTGLRRYGSFGIAALISSLIFGMFHFQLSLFIPIAFMGFVFSFLFERTRSILPSFAAHLAWNLLSFSAMIFGS